MIFEWESVHSATLKRFSFSGQTHTWYVQATGVRACLPAYSINIKMCVLYARVLLFLVTFPNTISMVGAYKCQRCDILSVLNFIINSFVCTSKSLLFFVDFVSSKHRKWTIKSIVYNCATVNSKKDIVAVLFSSIDLSSVPYGNTNEHIQSSPYINLKQNHALS